jgi:hypothetical protein
MTESEAKFGSTGDYPRLPAGRHNLPAEYLERYQRRRLVVAVAGLTVTKLCVGQRLEGRITALLGVVATEPKIAELALDHGSALSGRRGPAAR